MLLAQGAGVAVILITQVLLPPIFLHAYGVARYGEWLVLSATISYLGTLNFGVTTYAGNELTILRQRGDLSQYKRLQASTFALVLCLMAAGTIASAGVSLLPLPNLLHLRFVSRSEASFAALFLGLQMTAQIAATYYMNLFIVVQHAHRGTMWWNVLRLSAVLSAAGLAIFHRSFAAIAFGQLVAVLLVLAATIVDLRIRMKGLPLGLHGADWETAKSTLRPSGLFAMVMLQTFFLFQVPVILLQRILGPEVVVLFTISRTVLATARQVLSVVTSAIAPEITFSFGSGDQRKLLDIFHYSERLVFSLIPVANLGAYLFSPLLLAVWLHKPGLFDQSTYVLMAIISAVMSMREHKQFFQFATNTHYRLAHIVFWGNLLMIAISIPMTIHFGLHGFMYTWLVSETTQMALLYRENRKLFACDPSITILPVIKLASFMGFFFFPCVLLLDYARQHSIFVLGLLATVATVFIFAASWFVFGLGHVRTRILAGVSSNQ